MPDGSTNCPCCGSFLTSTQQPNYGQPIQQVQQPMQQSLQQQNYIPPTPQTNYSNYSQPANFSSSEEMRTGFWVKTLLLQCIPIANIVCLFVWAFGSNSNSARKAYAKAMLIFTAIVILLSIIITICAGSCMSSVINSMY